MPYKVEDGNRSDYTLTDKDFGGDLQKLAENYAKSIIGWNGVYAAKAQGLSIFVEFQNDQGRNEKYTAWVVEATSGSPVVPEPVADSVPEEPVAEEAAAPVEVAKPPAGRRAGSPA